MSEDPKFAELLLEEVRKERRYRYVKKFLFWLFMGINILVFLTIRSGMDSSESGNISTRLYKTIGGNTAVKEEAVIAILPLYGTIGMTKGSDTDMSEEIVKMIIDKIKLEPK